MFVVAPILLLCSFVTYYHCFCFWQMDFPFVAEAYGCVSMRDGFLIVLEFCEYGDLRQFLQNVKFADSMIEAARYGAPTMLQMAIQAMCGISYLHRQHMLHRDIAARNLLVTRDKQGTLTVKLADFGMTRAVEDSGSSSYYKINTTLDGTNLKIPVQHSPPEYFKKQESQEALGGDASFKATRCGDMWAAGVLLWEIATNGRTPYTSKGSISFKEKGLELTELPSSAFIQKYIEQGVRLCLPEISICPPAMRRLMQACWNQDSTARPTADEAIGILASDSLFAVKREWGATTELLDYLEEGCHPPVALLPGVREECSFFSDYGMVGHLLDEGANLQKAINEYDRDQDYKFDDIFPGGVTGEACGNFVEVLAELASFAAAIEEGTPLAGQIQEARERRARQKEGE